MDQGPCRNIWEWTGFFYFRIRWLLHIFYYKTVRGHITRLHGGRASNLWASAILRLPDCTGATTLMIEAFFQSKTDPFQKYYTLITLWHSLRLRPSSLHKPQVTWRLLTIFWNTRLSGGTLPNNTAAGSNLGASAHFLNTRLHGGNHSDDGSFFPRRNPILFNNIIMDLLHSCIHCDLDHSCSILHKSRDLHLA